jgi:crotonobetainyl-CoA:carnitine CoA-transferase CaiB-like acyl-CoA transferase
MSTALSMPPSLLGHLKVLDLSRILAAPWAGQILADLGADVIKVERPGAGDDTRSWGPPFLKDAEGKDGTEAGYYLAANRGKRSITVNLETPEGQAIVRKLASQCDIVLENFKVGTLARYGLDAATLRALNPRLIYGSVTGFGQTGPRAEQPAYDFLIQAMGGMMSVTGERDGLPGGGPQKVGIPVVDLMSGMYTVTAVLAALAHRDRTGEGQTIDIAMLDVQVATLANQAMNHLVSGKTPQRSGNAHPNIQPQDVYACADAELILVVGNDRQFAKLCEVLQVPQWSTDQRFASNAQRIRHLDQLNPMLRERLSCWKRADLLAKLDVAGVPSGPINNIKEVFEDPQVVARAMLRQVPHPSGVTVPLLASPMRFEGQALPIRCAPPLLGEHSADILSQLGYSADDITSLQRRGVV